MPRTLTQLLAASLLAIAAFVQPLAAAEEATTIPFPRNGGPVPVNLSNGPMVIRSVTLKNRPSAREVRRALRRDPDDTKTLRWVFAVSNAGRRDWRARIRVEVVAADGRLLARDSRADEVDARKWHDHISVWTKIRTTEYPAASVARVTVDFRPD
jgi:hypothetical protein